jgi:hypothetical protein
MGKYTAIGNDCEHYLDKYDATICLWLSNCVEHVVNLYCQSINTWLYTTVWKEKILKGFELRVWNSTILLL